MKEFDPGLTRPTPESTLRSEGNFMSDETGGENARPADEGASEAPGISDEVLAQRWAGRSSVPWEKLTSEQKQIFKELQPHTAERSKTETAKKAGEKLPTRGELEAFIRDLRSGRLSKSQKEAIFSKIRDIDLTSGISIDELRKMPPDERRAILDKIRQQEEERQVALAALGKEGIDAEVNDSSVDEREEMMKTVRELSSAVMRGDHDAIDEIIRYKLDNNRSSYAAIIAHVVNTLQGKEGGVHDYMLEYMLEYGVERILSTADINPKSPYPRFNLYEEMNLDGVIQMARNYDERAATMRGDPRPSYRVFKYLANLRTKRQAMHELFRGMKNRKTYVDLVTELLRKDGMAFVEKDIAGVSDIQIIYEEVLGSKLAFAKEGWLNGEDFEAVDEEVKEAFRYSMEENPGNYQKVFVRKEGYGGEKIYDTRKLRDWELDRAFNMGRNMGAASQRRLVYGVLGDMPKRETRSIKSIEFEFMARIRAPLKLLPWRFFYQPIARRYLERLVQELKRKRDGSIDHNKYGYVKDGKEKGLYGKSQFALAILDMGEGKGIPDPKTNGWRARNLFLEQRDFQTKEFEGEQVTIGEYLEKVKLQIEDRAKREAQASGDLKGEDWELEFKWEVLKSSERYRWKEWIKAEFNNRVANDIKGERLFLGTLMRHYDLTEANKAVIWENVAQLLPSRIAAFLPDETLAAINQIYGTDKAGSETVWNKFKLKLWLIERARVKEDARILGQREKPTKGLSDYYQGEGRIVEFTQQEIKLIEELQVLGKAHAKDFAKIKFPFTAFLDDVPKTDWEKLDDEDYDRIFVNDDSNYQDGFKELVSLIAFPGLKPKAVVEHLNKAFDNIEQPYGRSDTQKYMEVHLNTYLPMARQTKKASWVGWIMENLYMPRSEMEKYNLAGKIAQDEKDQEEIIYGVAAHETISADTTKADKNGKTQLMRVLERNKADKKYQFLRWVRLIMQILGPIAGKEFVKMILPGNLSKDLGL